MFPEKRTSLFGVACVTHVVDGKTHEHLLPLATMRIVAGGAADLQVASLGAEQMSGALEQSFALVSVAAQTGFLYGEAGQHLLREFDLLRIQCWPIDFGSVTRGQRPLGEFGMVHVVTRHATHVASVVLTALPVEMTTIAGVTLKADSVGPSSLFWSL